MATDLFVGRERELARLREAFGGVCEGDARVVMLAGEPGGGPPQRDGTGGGGGAALDARDV